MGRFAGDGGVRWSGVVISDCRGVGFGDMLCCVMLCCIVLLGDCVWEIGRGWDMVKGEFDVGRVEGHLV